MAVLGEEMGFIGIVLLVLVYGFLIFRGFQISIQSQDKFKKYLALGLILSFSFSVFINIGVVTGLLPTKGLTMPFMSYGGSSLLAQSILFGLLINIEMSEKSVALYRKVAEKMPNNPKAPMALFMTGFIYENDLGDLNRAKDAYESFLKKYPQDPDFADDAQMALQLLGKSPEEIIKSASK